jgi:hypothetical protein
MVIIPLSEHLATFLIEREALPLKALLGSKGVGLLFEGYQLVLTSHYELILKAIFLGFQTILL